jgi:hypothetical protein
VRRFSQLNLVLTSTYQARRSKIERFKPESAISKLAKRWSSTGGDQNANQLLRGARIWMILSTQCLSAYELIQTVLFAISSH